MGTTRFKHETATAVTEALGRAGTAVDAVMTSTSPDAETFRRRVQVAADEAERGWPRNLPKPARENIEVGVTKDVMRQAHAYAQGKLSEAREAVAKAAGAVSRAEREALAIEADWRPKPVVESGLDFAASLRFELQALRADMLERDERALVAPKSAEELLRLLNSAETPNVRRAAAEARLEALLTEPSPKPATAAEAGQIQREREHVRSQLARARQARLTPEDNQHLAGWQSELARLRKDTERAAMHLEIADSAGGLTPGVPPVPRSA